MCVNFVESVHGLNECMCYVHMCVSQYVCCISIVKPRPMCVHDVPTCKPMYIGFIN